jgi:hypothetical protein
MPVGLDDVIHTADVGMRDLARRADFVMEARQPVGVSREILRAIHFSHPASADQGQPWSLQIYRAAGRTIRRNGSRRGFRARRPGTPSDGQQWLH